MSPSKPNPGVPVAPTPPSQPAVQPFEMGWRDADLQQALAIADPVARRTAVDALQRTGPRKLSSPQAGRNTQGQPSIPAPPADASLATVLDLLLVAVAARLRDVPLEEIEGHPDAQRAVEILRPIGGPATTRELFVSIPTLAGTDRVGELVGRPIPNGWGAPSWFDSFPRLGSYITTEAAWRALEAGNLPGHPDLPTQQRGTTPVQITTGRAMASLAHQDTPMGVMYAVAMQLHFMRVNGAPLPRSSRFPVRPNEDAFTVYGGIFDLETALMAASRSGGLMGWKGKWETFRRRRPHQLWREAMVGNLHPQFRQLGGVIIEWIGDFLSQVYAEGPPVHSSYISGHALFAAMLGTVLKAYFPDIAIPSLGITSLHREIDRMVDHDGMGRQFAGIHYPTDIFYGYMLGQHYAIQWLNQAAQESPMPLGDTTFLGFDGKPVTLRGDGKA